MRVPITHGTFATRINFSNTVFCLGNWKIGLKPIRRCVLISSLVSVVYVLQLKAKNKLKIVTNLFIFGLDLNEEEEKDEAKSYNNIQ